MLPNIKEANMLVGEIIKYYREKKGISQSKLGEGICGKAYISRFEGGKVALTPEFISKLADRLEIDINNEIESLNEIENHLNDWNHALIMQKTAQIEEIKLELEQNPFIKTSKHAVYYLLLTAKYYHFKGMFLETKNTIAYVEKKFSNLSNYEKNLLLHIKGMYCISTFGTVDSELFQTAVNILEQINMDEYKNEEYYYHLALAYHHAKAKIFAYKYAERALQFFNKTSNYVSAISAQIIILMQFDSDQEIDFLELVGNYKNLIHNCEVLDALENKIIILSNLGEEFFKRGYYSQAAHYFEKAVLLTDKTDETDKISIKYVRRLYHFVEACLEGELLNQEELLAKIEIGTKLAKKACPIFFNLFNLFALKCKQEPNQYYELLAEVVIPQLISTNNIFFYEQYGKKLFRYYLKIKEYKKAIELDQDFSFMN
ncbi:hypothetical protein COJ46_01730 [Bacillus sp. AFS077874]|nr:hypothetical protein CON00_04310 [Bacillus sp. AFS096315]PFM83266.1 hypothetical protein COJ46_01730 [Bacillus sp. AFS077874]